MATTSTRHAPLPLAAAARLEVVPIHSAEEQLGSLPAGTIVTVTCSPRHGIDHTLEFTERWAVRGLRVVPHLSARLVESPAHVERLAQQITAAGVTEVFVIGGDRSEPVGPYAAAAELLVELVPLLPGVSIGVAGYPEGHPFIEPAGLVDALAAKQPYVSSIVTQLCFDPAAIVAFVRSIRRAGVMAPVLVGVAGVIERRRLVELSLRLGVGASTSFLRKNLRAAARLVTRPYDPSELVERLDAHRMAEPELGIVGLHVFTFNQIAATKAWLRSATNEGRSEP